MTATALRRRAAATPSFTPAKLTNVVAWWHADDLVGADGSSISSWADRLGGVAGTNTLGNRPTIQVNSLNGRQGVAFNGATPQWLTISSIGSLPTVGPVTCYIVWKPTSMSATTDPFAVMSSASNGWRTEVQSTAGKGTLTMVANGVVAMQGLGVTRATVNTAALHKWTLTAGGTSTFRQGNYGMYDTSASTGAAASGATAAVIGRDNVHANNPVTGVIYDVIVCSSVLGDSDDALLAAWVERTYGIAAGGGHLNTATYTTTPGADGSGTCVESSVLDFGAGGWNGKRYWCAFVPLGSGSNANENPTLLNSTDGDTWSAASGVSVPLIAKPSSANNADPSLFDNTARDGKVYLFWSVENATPTSAGGVWWSSSTDGVTWTARAQLTTAAGSAEFSEPHMVYDATSGNYWLYTINLANPASPSLNIQTCSTPTGTFSAKTDITTLNSRSQKPWHMGNIVKIGSKWVMALSDLPSNRCIYLFSSTDGTTWTSADHAILTPKAGAWDAYSMYRLTLSYDGTTLTGWYNAQADSSGTTFHMSQKITIPLSEVP